MTLPNTSHDLRTLVITTIVILTMVVSGLGPTPIAAAATSTAISLQPSSQQVSSGETVTYDLVLETADGGIGAFGDINISVSDTDIATISDITTDIAVNAETKVTTDGSEASVNLPFGGDTANSGQITIATVTLQTHAEGNINLGVDVTGDISDEQGSLYSITSENGASLTVGSPTEEVQLAISANDTTPTVGDAVAFTVTRDDTGSTVDATVSVDGTTLSTGADGTVTYTFESSGTFTATASKADTTDTTFLEANTEITVSESLETAVSLQPASQQVQSGETATYNIVLESASGGIGAFDDINVTVNDTGVATIADISTDIANIETEITTDGSEASINLPFGGDTSDTGEVTLATVELQTHTGGGVQLGLDVTDDISNEQGALYSVTSENDATLAVSDDTDEEAAAVIVIDDQSYEESTDSVTVANATWTGAGSFAVAIHNSSAGVPGPIIGWSMDMANGTKTDLTINLEQNITSNVTATAILHESVNDPAITRGGSPVSDTAKITITPGTATTPPGLPPLPGDDDDRETAVNLQPTNKQVTTGNSVTYDIVVEDVDNGIQTYEFNVSINSTTTATITDFSLQGTNPSELGTDVSWGSNNGSISVEVASGNHSNGVIGSITVTGKNAGTAELSLKNVLLGDTMFNSYSISSTGDATISIEPAPSDGVIAELAPATVSASTSSTATVDVRLQNIDNGVRSYEFTASVTDTDIATITGVSLVGTSGSNLGTSVSISDDGSKISVSAASGDIMNNAIGTIELTTQGTGTTKLKLSDIVVGDTDFDAYTIADTNPATIEVSRSTTPEVVPAGPAQNANSDPQLEDINGDGNFNIIDVGALLANRASDAVQNNVDLFDFNGDGSVNIIDVGKLLQEATA